MRKRRKLKIPFPIHISCPKCGGDLYPKNRDPRCHLCNTPLKITEVNPQIRVEIRQTKHKNNKKKKKTAVAAKYLLDLTKKVLFFNFTLPKFRAKLINNSYWPYRLVARTHGSQPCNRGSIPLKATKKWDISGWIPDRTTFFNCTFKKNK